MESLLALKNLNNLQIAWQALLINLILSAVFAFLLQIFYIKFGQSLSNRARLARNFLPIAVTTALVITIVKSSLALSLGLVGALSIVRFRTAIKDPEELAYLFLSIAIGLGFGANQRLVTIMALIIILVILFCQRLLSRQQNQNNNLYLTLNYSPAKKAPSYEQLVKLISSHVKFFELTRLETANKKIELSGYVKFASASSLTELTQELTKKYPHLKITLLDTATIN